MGNIILFKEPYQKACFYHKPKLDPKFWHEEVVSLKKEILTDGNVVTSQF